VRSRRLIASGAAVISLAFMVTSCSSSNAGGSSPSGGSTHKSGALNGHGQTLILFTGQLSDSYPAQWYKGAQAEAAKYNYKLKLIADNNDQTEENTQADQQVATGAKPAAYIWWPDIEDAGFPGLRALANTGVPVMQANVEPNTMQYLKFYTGTNFGDNGVSSAKALIQARQALIKSGDKLHSAGGNLIEIAWPQDFPSGTQKLQGLDQGLSAAQPFKLLTRVYSTGFDNAAGYAAMNSVIPKYRSEGIDFVWAANDAVGAGVIQALNQAGLKPGKDIYVIGANCHGDTSDLVNNTQYSSILVGGRLEGEYFITSVAEYLAGEKVQPGVYRAPATPGSMPDFSGTLHQRNYLPQIPVTFNTGSPSKNTALLTSTKLWGLTMQQACNY
jgi:ribose transport system substrate-binding protein